MGYEYTRLNENLKRETKYFRINISDLTNKFDYRFKCTQLHECESMRLYVYIYTYICICVYQKDMPRCTRKNECECMRLYVYMYA